VGGSQSQFPPLPCPVLDAFPDCARFFFSHTIDVSLLADLLTVVFRFKLLGDWGLFTQERSLFFFSSTFPLFQSRLLEAL